MSELDLTFRQRLGWIAHVFKAATQNHHPELERLFAPMIAKDAVIADVGAHAGQFAKIFARLAPQGRIYAFEPSSYALSVLPLALGFNGMKHVTIEPYGLSDAPGSFTMSTPLKRGRAEVGFGLAHLGTDDDRRPMRVESIEVRTLDSFSEAVKLARLDFLKADVEGWEARMLMGGQGTLARFKPTLFLEIVESSLARAGSTGADIFNLLSAIGYRAQKLNLDATLSDVNAFSGDSDYLFLADRG
ncbi:MAG: FkbM family methyltransferase [Alphaproteobacteria bacterium]|nr:FkbM family methyltransferase [Alphaproteobacteria bacterium]